jgi:hypothetical protein
MTINEPKEKPQFRELEITNGKYKTYKKIQHGATLRNFNAKSLLNDKTNISKILAVLNTTRSQFVGKPAIHKKSKVKLNSLSPALSTLFSLGFVDRQPVGKRRLLYRLKPGLDISDRQALYEQAVRAKNEEKGV